jgi:hypothetical protein
MTEEFVTFELAEKLKEKGYNKPFYFYYRTDDELIHHVNTCDPLVYSDKIDDEVVIAPTISQVLKWLREEKNIDVEIHAEAGMLGNKVYVPFISTYTEFTLETSPDVIRYRQKKFNPAKPLSHEIILALTYFNKWEEAALDAIEYVINNLI